MATYESKKYATIPILASQIADQSVSNAEFETLDGADTSTTIQAQLNSVLGAGGGTMTGNLYFNDDVKARFGDNQDLEIFHDGNDSIIADTGTGALEVRASVLNVRNAADSQDMIQATEGGAVTLYHNNSAKAATTSSGLNVTGTLSATTAISGPLSGNGSSITSINGSNISSGTVADARISTLTSSKLSGPLPAIDGSALTGLPTGVATGVTDVGAIQLCYYDITNSTAAIARGSTTSGANLKVVPTSNTQFQYGTFSGSAPAPAGGSTIGSGTWLALTGTTTANVNTGGGTATRYGPGLFIRIS